MDPTERQAEEVRIRKALEINSFDLAALEHYLLREKYVPNSTDEQVARDTVFELRKLFDNTVDAFCPGSSHESLADLFVASKDASTDAEKRESESIKYDAVKDLILMLAKRRAQASPEQEEQESPVIKKEKT